MTTLNTPPLRQSTYETMACPHSYKLIHIDGLKTPDSVASTRGTEVHDVLAHYVEHCAKRRVPADFMHLDMLRDSVGEEAAEILEVCRDSFTVDWENFFAAEATLALDDQFQPTMGPGMDENKMIFTVGTLRGGKPAYSGTLDTIYLMPGNRVARIVDYKSHPRPFEPTTFQAKLYSLMLMMHIPELQEVEFVLRFVRYSNVHKPITFTRRDVPQLMEDVRRVKARQIEYHEQDDAMEPFAALAGTHCTYCPAVSDFSCPIAKLNPMTNLTPAERLNYRLWHDAANRVNNQTMQQWVDSTGQSIHGQDANGKHYTFGPKQKENTTYPIFKREADGGFSMPIVDALLNWADAAPEDLVPNKKTGRAWFENLRIGSTELNQYLKTNKREVIHNNIRDLATVETKVELRVSRDAEVDDGTGEEHRDYEAEGAGRWN